MDPAPFRERDLDPNAETYIVEWARETPRRQPLAARRAPRPRARRRAATSHAARRRSHEYFRQRAAATRRELRQLFRVGRISLLIGLAFLAVAIVDRRVRRGPGEQGALRLRSSRRASSSAAGSRCGGRSRSSCTTGGRSAPRRGCSTGWARWTCALLGDAGQRRGGELRHDATPAPRPRPQPNRDARRAGARHRASSRSGSC